jgi:hypothetical protein
MAFSTDVYDIMTLEEEYLIPKEERGVHEDSYECFRRLKDEGKLPMPNRSVLSRRFTEAESRQWIAPSLPSPATPDAATYDTLRAELLQNPDTARERVVEAASPILTWLAMVEAHQECAGLDPYADSAIALSFMGSGASTRVTIGELRELRDAVAALGEDTNS